MLLLYIFFGRYASLRKNNNNSKLLVRKYLRIVDLKVANDPVTV